MTACVTAAGAEDRANILVLQLSRNSPRRRSRGTGENTDRSKQCRGRNWVLKQGFPARGSPAREDLFDVACGSDDPDRIPGS